MESIIKKIKAYYPVSDEALAALTYNFKPHSFPAKETII